MSTHDAAVDTDASDTPRRVDRLAWSLREVARGVAVICAGVTAGGFLNGALPFETAVVALLLLVTLGAWLP